jgi:hypothetical protein
VSRTSVLGGDTRSRGMFSGRRSRKVMIARYGTCAVVLVLLVLLQVVGLLLGAALLALVFMVTADTGGGRSISHWVQDKRRWRYRVRGGFTEFVPVDLRPDDRDPTAGETKAERRESQREWNAFRDWPDGATNLYWLESSSGTPAVAYHAPAGVTPYLSMAFSVDGPVQGLHGDAFVDQAQAAFGQLMAGWGAGQKLVSGIQVITRVIPADSALFEMWLEDQLDPEAPADLRSDYTGLLASLSSSSFVQRHYVVITIAVGDQFKATAKRHRDGLQGWLDVATVEGASAAHRLEGAMYRNVKALSGPQLAAVLRHLQHPDWPIDRASDVTVDTCWLRSHDEKAWTEVTAEYPDPLEPDVLMPASTWYHRTAEIPAAALEVREIDGLWLTPLLTGLDEQIVRTLSTHIAFTPAREAKITARKDATTDQRDLIEAERKGRMVDDETELALSAANRRMADLRDGGGHHGGHWAAWITVSARTHQELVTACTVIEAAAADEAGINRLDWLDTIQSGAQATTWPLGRGMSTPAKTVTTKVMTKVSTATAKEAIS